MLVQVLDFVACHVWVNTVALPASTLRHGTPCPYICRGFFDVIEFVHQSFSPLNSFFQWEDSFFRYLIFIFSNTESISLKEKRHDVGIHFDQLRGVL